MIKWSFILIFFSGIILYVAYVDAKSADKLPSLVIGIALLLFMLGLISLRHAIKQRSKLS